METIIEQTSEITAENVITLEFLPTEIQQIFSLLLQAEKTDLLDKFLEQFKTKMIDYQTVTKPIAYRDYVNLEQIQEFLGLSIEEYIFFLSPPV